ncbi:MAG: MoaD/ThiS family protein [Anaerolineae bacterium]|nr:MoaD/ThiS family protein [Anaerolineae bacterium]
MKEKQIKAIIQVERLPGEPRQSIEVVAGVTILEALASVGVSLQQPVVALVNGKTSDMNYVVRPGDYVVLLPQIAGG